MNNTTPGGHENYLPITSLKGVGPKVAERLARLDIHSIEDLLFHLPYRYEDRTRITPIGAVRAGNEVVIQGKIELTEIKFARRRMLLSRLSDGTGFITLRFFHFNARQQAALTRGVTLRCYGEVRLGSMGLEMTHPEYQYIDNDKPVEIEQTLTPVYSTTEGLHQLSMRNLTEQALAKLQSNELTLSELIPADLLQSPNLPTLEEAVQFLHRPPPDIDLESLAEGKHPMQQRLVFEELLAHTLSLRQLRSRMRKHQALALQSKGNLSGKFLHTLEFQFTRAQQRVINEIEMDLQAAVPMQRLVQGDGAHRAVGLKGAGNGKACANEDGARDVAQVTRGARDVAGCEDGLCTLHLARIARDQQVFDSNAEFRCGHISTRGAACSGKNARRGPGRATRWRE